MSALGRVSDRWLWAGYALALALLALALASVAYDALFSIFLQADDSGYVLVSLKGVREGAALYDEVYSQYGPGYFVLVGGTLQLLGIDLTGDNARFATEFLWLSASFLVGVALLRLTRSILISASGLVVAFLALSNTPNEPLHPISTIALLLTAMAAAAALLLPERPRAAMATLGALAGALLLIKVNVGLLALAAIAFALVVTLPSLRPRAVVRVVACVVLVEIPLFLLAGNLDQDWALRYAGVVALGGVALALVATKLPAGELPSQGHLASLAAGVAGVVAFVLVITLIEGTSISGLVDGVVRDPLKLDDIFTVELILDPLTPLWCALAAGAALLVRQRLAGPDAPAGEAERALFGALRVAAGLALWVYVAAPNAPFEEHAAVAAGSALIWVAAVPAGEARPETTFLRALLASLALLQLLHGYPVAGTQLGPGYMLVAVVGGICVADGVEELSRFGSSLRPAFAHWRAVWLVPVVAFAAWVYLNPLRDYIEEAGDRYAAGKPVDLPGAERLRLDPELGDAFAGVVAGINEHCRAFLTMPGLNSLYLYTHQDPPTWMNGTAWMWLFDRDKQREILDQVRDVDDLCVVRNQLIVNFWASSLGMPPERPLTNFIDENFVLVERYGADLSFYDIGLQPKDVPKKQ